MLIEELFNNSKGLSGKCLIEFKNALISQCKVCSFKCAEDSRKRVKSPKAYLFLRITILRLVLLFFSQNDSNKIQILSTPGLHCLAVTDGILIFSF